MPPPVTFRAAAWLPGEGSGLGYPDGLRTVWAPHRMESWTHSVTATGGEESAEVQITSPLPSAMIWMDAVGGMFHAYDRGAMRIFHGTITTVAINDGVKEWTQTTDGMANAVTVVYTTKTGRPQATTIAQNADSRARYWRRHLIYSGSSKTQADSQRDALLSGLAWPLENTVSGLTQRPSRGQASVTIQAKGWWHAMSWSAYKQEASIGTNDAKNLIWNLVTETLDSTAPSSYGNNVTASSVFYMTYTGPTERGATGPATGIQVPVTQGYEYASEVAARVLGLNAGDGTKIAWGFNLGLRTQWDTTDASYLWAREWAGSNPSVSYYLDPPYSLYNAALCPIPWSRARPDVIAQHLRVIPRPPRSGELVGDTDRSGRLWVQRITYSWARGQGESLTLEPEGSKGADVVLSRMK